MKTAIVFLGNICSGKTTLSHYFVDKYPWDEVSFSKYIRNRATQNKQSHDRGTLQDLGFKVVTDLNPERFLAEVIKFSDPKSQTHVYDSIRHTDIFIEVINHYDKKIVFFINVDNITLYERYVDKYQQKISCSDFIKEVLDHPVEREVNSLKEKSNYVLDGSKGIDEIVSEIESKLVEHGFLDHDILERRGAKNE